MIGLFSLFILTVSPGAWVTFGLSLPGIPFWPKLLIGSALSPLIVALEFYIFRILGAPFELTSYLIVLLNLPALYLVHKQFNRDLFPDLQTLASYTIIPLILLLALAPPLFLPQYTIFTGHAWMHTDTVYMLANGELVLEHSLLAGVRQSYPWAGHIFQAIASFLLDAPPASSYIWTTLVYLIIVCFFLILIVDRFGGNLYSKVTAPVWLLFGVNFLGFPLHLGDFRYTPFMMEFPYFSQMPFAMGIFIAVAYILVTQDAQRFERYLLIVIGLLLIGNGTVYPLIFPSTCILVGAKIISLILVAENNSIDKLIKPIGALGLVLFIAGVISVVHFNFILVDRVASHSVQLNLTPNLIRKGVDSIVAPMAYWVGLAFVFKKYWENKLSELLVLILGALGSMLLYILILIPPLVEYKFMFPVIICLAPFPSLALEPLMKRLGRWSVPAFGLIFLVLITPYVYKMNRHWPGIAPETAVPLIDRGHFSMRLDDQEPLSGLYDSIRDKTPLNSLIIADQVEHNLPTLTRRRLYVPPRNQFYIGVNFPSDHLLLINRGYDGKILKERRTVLHHLYNDDEFRRDSLRILQDFNRPLAIVLNIENHEGLYGWLIEEGKGSEIFKDHNLVVWLIATDET
jgi:hypothetical protein